MSIAQTERDSRGRFQRGNQIAAVGGHARAAKLSKRKRRAIARKGYRAMVAKHFSGDTRAQRLYLADLGRYAYEVQAGSYQPGSPLRTSAQHPGPIQEWLSRYWQPGLLAGAHLDVEFFDTKRCGRCQTEYSGPVCPICAYSREA
jgi:hypothetical protein